MKAVVSVSVLVVVVLVVGVVLPSPGAASSHVLFLSPFGSRSHMMSFTALGYELARRGHQVTHITCHKPPSPQPAGYRAVVVDGAAELIEDAGNVMWQQEGDSTAFLTLLAHVRDASLRSCHLAFQDAEFKELKAGGRRVDLVIVSMFLTDCMVPLALELGAPYAFISPADVFPLVSTAFGNRLSPSFVPFPVFPFTDRMTFLQRFVNVLGTTVLDFFMSWSLDALVDQVNLAEYGPGTPTVAELRRNASLLILNTVPGMELAKPIMPGVVQAGGMHCKPSKPLPKELEDWVSGSSNGFIYFSLGSAVQGKMMPEKFRKMFVEAFARFPQYRILWKWETEVMDDLPKHVKLSKWLPQQDLLGHKDIKLFITHGGLLSTQEATYHGVPVVGIPIGADQMLNMKRTENEGAGLTLEWSSLTTEGIYNAVLRVLSEPSFRENLKRRSAIMRDQPQTPLDRAVYWTEYVIRHKGAAHLRSAARDLTWWQYHLLDVWLFVGAVLLGFLLVAYFVTRCFLRCLGRKLFGVPAAMGDKKRQ